MPKILITNKEEAALKKVAPAYLKRTTQRVRWAIDQAIANSQGESRKKRKAG